jgi:predicted Rdx family selenoprotein
MPLDIVIRYSVARGFEDEALALARRLFATFDEAIDSLALLPVEGGDDEEFALYLNGRLVRSRRQSGRPPQVADVRAALAGS